MEKLNIIDILKKANNSYYNTGEYLILSDEDKEVLNTIIEDIQMHSEVTDELYDRIYNKAKELIPEAPFFNTIGASIDDYGNEIEFSTPMGSLVELKEGDWDKWKENKEYNITEKFDGLSVILFYKEGKLLKAATRGDGYKGKDITRHILKIPTIPKYLNCVADIEIRGELLCPKADISKMIADLKEETGREYKNGRNTIAGFLNSKETLNAPCKYVHFIAFWNSCPGFSSEASNELGDFEVPKRTFITNQFTEDNLINFVKDVKENSLYECDGIVINQVEKDEGFETSSINPKYSRKFKIGAVDNTGETTVLDIKWQISRYGKFTPVLEIEPTDIQGTTITSVTAHNFDQLKKQGAGIGSKIIVKRAGDVIPYLEKVIESSEDFNLPKVDTIQEGVDLKLNDWSDNIFTYQIACNKLSYFCQALEIDMFGPGYAETLMREFVNKTNVYMTPFDLISMPEDEIFKQIGVNGSKVYESLHKKLSNITEPELFDALGTFGTGIGKSLLNTLYEKFDTLDVSGEQLVNISGWGDKRKTIYFENYNNYIKEKNKFLSLGFKFKSVEKNKDGKFSNYYVAFTGIRDKELMQLIVNNGGIATEAWNKDVNLLVAKDPFSSSGKAKNARDKGIKIISHEEAIKLFNEKSEDIEL